MSAFVAKTISRNETPMAEALFSPWPEDYTHIHTDIRTLDAATAAATVATAATAATAVAATTAVTAMMIFMMVMTVMTVMIW